LGIEARSPRHLKFLRASHRLARLLPLRGNSISTQARRLTRWLAGGERQTGKALEAKRIWSGNILTPARHLTRLVREVASAVPGFGQISARADRPTFCIESPQSLLILEGLP